MKKFKLKDETRGHGRTTFFVEGVGMIGGDPIDTGLMTAAQPAIAAAAGQPTGVPPAFRFCQMFNLPAFQPDAAGLIELGLAMEDTAPAAANSTIPAGFTYFGQFVDHDITFDKSALDETQSLSVDDMIQSRSPALDLDSLYGLGPDLSSDMYEADKVRLKLGTTTDRAFQGSTPTVLPNDLPRLPVDANDPSESSCAIIGDPRNDENLAVAQIHVAFIKFHNAVANSLAAGNLADQWSEARKIVTQHYQSIVLHDFVPQLVAPDIYEDVVKHGRKFYMPGGLPKGKNEHPCMPLEFSVGAYRIGHSMIRDVYFWNKVFTEGGLAPGTLALLFEFSAVSGDLGGEDTLPTDWVADFRRLFSFPGVPDHPELNFARLLDTRLARSLTSLPEFATESLTHRRSLAARNLLRGRQVGLPTGQDIANAMGVVPLTAAEVKSGDHGTILEKHGFHEKTPLWYYILIEAEVQHGGRRLGAVGSRLIVETFHGLIEGSQHSILKQQGWKPTVASTDPDHFSFADMLTFVGDINPLGD